jgi:hypothetical protein
MIADLMARDVDWTLVRACRVVPGVSGRGPRAGTFRLGPWNCVLDGDLAGYMVRALADPATIHAAPMIKTR